jgi:hypothetical protein
LALLRQPAEEGTATIQDGRNCTRSRQKNDSRHFQFGRRLHCLRQNRSGSLAVRQPTGGEPGGPHRNARTETGTPSTAPCQITSLAYW